MYVCVCEKQIMHEKPIEDFQGRGLAFFNDKSILLNACRPPLLALSPTTSARSLAYSATFTAGCNAAKPVTRAKGLQEV